MKYKEEVEIEVIKPKKTDNDYMPVLMTCLFGLLGSWIFFDDAWEKGDFWLPPLIGMILFAILIFKMGLTKD